jgi:hypothetical protein
MDFVTFGNESRLKGKSGKQASLMDTTKTKVLKLAMVCILCITLVSGLAWLISLFIS